MYRSINNGGSWSIVGFPQLSTLALALSGNKIFAGTFGSGVFLSTNNGEIWNDVNNGY
ncbi:MAG: hypothetical protein IPG02_14690 [Ignavibacteria bacterium]|nr:hypothetical protein [Ignavibacteria bacterium]